MPAAALPRLLGLLNHIGGVTMAGGSAKRAAAGGINDRTTPAVGGRARGDSHQDWPAQHVWRIQYGFVFFKVD